MLQGMIDTTKRAWKMPWNGNEYGKNKVIRLSRQPSPVQIVIDQKQLENVEYCKYLGSTMTN